ncbi:MAG: DUF896 domain-containing protein [Clostridia bacterium]|nr:DUF896 domain-containing protein [Clostridia bacterium]
MEKEKIERINLLAKKQKEGTLTSEEKEEQARLRKEYIEEYKNSLKVQLDNTYIVDEFGNKTKLKKK